MLAALLENNNNARQQPQPMIKIDRGGGGASWPSYEIVDIITATAAFPEISGEDPVARAVRRTRWIGDALPFIREAREKQAAAAFLAGAQLADAAADARHAAQDQLKIEQMIAIIDGVRTSPAKRAAPAMAAARGGSSGGSGIGLFVGGLVVGGIVAAVLLSKRASQQRRFV